MGFAWIRGAFPRSVSSHRKISNSLFNAIKELFMAAQLKGNNREQKSTPLTHNSCSSGGFLLLSHGRGLPYWPIKNTFQICIWCVPWVPPGAYLNDASTSTNKIQFGNEIQIKTIVGTMRRKMVEWSVKVARRPFVKQAQYWKIICECGMFVW